MFEYHRLCQYSLLLGTPSLHYKKCDTYTELWQPTTLKQLATLWWRLPLIKPPAFIQPQNKFQLRHSCPWTSNWLFKWLRAQKWSLRRLGVKSLLTSRDRWNCWECAYGYDLQRWINNNFVQTNIAAGGTNQRRDLRPWIGVDRFPPDRSSYNEQNRREWWAAPCSSPPSGTNPCAPFWKPRWCWLSNPQQHSKRHKLKVAQYVSFNVSTLHVLCMHWNHITKCYEVQHTTSYT